MILCGLPQCVITCNE